MTDDNREVASLALGESPFPRLLALCDDVSVEVGIQVGTPVMASPAVGMKGSYFIGIRVRRIEVVRNKILLSHADLPIDPGSGTVR